MVRRNSGDAVHMPAVKFTLSRSVSKAAFERPNGMNRLFMDYPSTRLWLDGPDERQRLTDHLHYDIKFLCR